METDCKVMAGEVLGRFVDRGRCEELCRLCPRYGARWGCPPLDDADCGLLSMPRVAVAVVSGVDADADLRALRAAGEAVMLRYERATGGRAAALPGDCPYCGGEECARVAGRRCRHEESVRPSLEAMGVDVCALSASLGYPMEWGGRALTLVAALGFDGPDEAVASLGADLLTALTRQGRAD